MTLYLDANATEPLRPAARQAVLEALDCLGNPSSVHAEGRAARQLLERARATIATRFGGRARDLVFTAGATEANALALHGLGQGRRVLAGATEHPAILRAAPGIETLPVLADGTIDLAALERALAQGGPALLCLMAAHNETGVLHPLAEAAALCRAHGALLHVDAVQMAGRLKLDLSELGADSLALGPTSCAG
ncbi:cysteine desulfurase family protein [Pseudoroseomonas cervicalis]|uniref:cysteine desulfurase family protein n=1 Tax=Teichococcus cervicalis TaxID=204525 RepID=UPI0035E71EFB